MVTPADLIVLYPEFDDPAFSEALVQAWLNQAYKQIRVDRLGGNADMAVMLWTAHNLVLRRRQTVASAMGADMTGPAGALASKTVGPTSVSFDAPSSSIRGAGPYNKTSYGQEFYLLCQRCSMGGMLATNEDRGLVWP
jgi:hypothetical protein